MFSLFSFSKSTLIVYLLRIPAILLALTVHESAHGWMAYKMGDETAYNSGRITLNPLKHLDPIGTLCMLLFGFGWASPVPINARNFRNPKVGTALTALAGPLSNLILGFIGVLLYDIAYVTLYQSSQSNVVYAVMLFLQVFYMLNISLAVFNLIPIPPFDGSRILFVFLPVKIYFAVMKYERIIMVVFLALLWLDIITLPLSYAVNAIIKLFFTVIELIPGL